MTGLATPVPAAKPATAAVAPMTPTAAIDCKVEKLFYGDFLAVRDSRVPIEKEIGRASCRERV